MTKKNGQELKVITSLKNPFQFMAYALKYRLKEILAIIIILLLGWILITNVTYTKKDGFQWKPSIKVQKGGK